MYFDSQSRYSEYWSIFSNYLVDLSEKTSDKMASENWSQTALRAESQLSELFLKY